MNEFYNIERSLCLSGVGKINYRIRQTIKINYPDETYKIEKRSRYDIQLSRGSRVWHKERLSTILPS